MKNLKTVFAGLFITALTLFTGCDPNDDVASAPEIKLPPTPAAFQNVRTIALQNQTQNFQFDAADGIVSLVSNNGVQININTNCLTLNGNAITGTIDLEYVELFEKGNMLTTNKPTMGLLPNGDKALLISGGEFLLEATQGGLALDTSCPLQLIVPSDLTNGDDPAMTLWEGDIDANGNLTWDEVEDQTGQGNLFVEGGNYFAFINDFGWSNIDRFYNDLRPKTLIKAKAPTGFNFENSAIYLSYDGEDSGLANLDTYDQALNLFSEHYGQIPIGLECHAIFVTEDNGQWRYAIKPITIADNDIITFELSDTTLATEAQLISIINALP